MSKSFKTIMVLMALIVGVFAIFVVKAMNNTSPEPVSAAVAEPVVKEPALATIPTIHTDPKMALTYANQRLTDLKADYARNAALYQDKDAQGLLDIRSELIDGMSANKSDHTSEMRFFMGCDQAYQSLVSLNHYYRGESIHQDGHDLEIIAKHETDYDYWLSLCEDNIQSSLDL